MLRDPTLRDRLFAQSPPPLPPPATPAGSQACLIVKDDDRPLD